MADAPPPAADHVGVEPPDGMKHVCVYLGGHVGYRKRYVDEAETLGRRMAADGVGLVYGGARVGLMGVLANAVLSNGGFATGVVPRQLAYQELAHEGLSRLYVVDTMHQRKYRMQSLCHACLALPGGFGTVEEIFEALTWAQKPLLLHEKPCVFVNVDGYYDHLFRFLDHATAEGLLLESNRALARQAPTAAAALRDIQAAWDAEEEALQQMLREYRQ